MNIVGLDLSLTATGVASSDGTTSLIGSKARGMERLAAMRDALIDATHCTDQGSGPRCDACGLYGVHPDLVVLEGYSMGTARQSSHAHALGELGGVVRLALWQLDVAYVDVPPASLKKYATGKGNATKELMLVSAVKRLGYQGSDNNEADALWLRAMGMQALGQPVVEMPQVNLAALAAVAWPALAVAS